MKKLLLILVVLGFLTAGVAYWISASSNGTENGYSYEGVKYGSLSEVVSATGIVIPRDIALVFCKVPGTVEEIYPYARVGQKVEKDQPLFKVGSEFAKRGLERAQAGRRKANGLRDSAKSAVDYLKFLADNRAPQPKEKELEAQAKYHAAVEGVEEAESALNQAQLAMDWTTVKAPIAGTIIAKNLYIGQPVGPSAAAGGAGSAGGSSLAPSSPAGSGSGPSTSSLFGMTEPKIPFIIAADLGDLEVYAQIPQGDIGRVKPGDPVKFTVDAFPDERPFEGKVTDVHLMPVNVLGSNFYPAVIKVANRRVGQVVGQANPNAPKTAKSGELDWVLRPGMTVNVDITRETHNDVWLLPSAAMSFTLDDYFITREAKKRIDDDLKSKTNPGEWKAVWVMGKDKKPWPIFARVGGKNSQGRAGINNENFTEVLEWDVGKEIAQPKADSESTFPQLIIAAPQPKQSILNFDKLPFKIS